MTATERFGENVLRLRQLRKLSQDQLAKEAQVHRTQITLIETGKRQPGIETAVKLAGALEVPPETLFDGIRWSRRSKSFVIFDPSEPPREPDPLPSDED